ncbi:MAG TPA: hypothetical protein VFE50_17020 [Cyclobacteriaceae bacterium]|nr:hypothetical protein [Cyclobacteriaceae bacterium]
MSRLILVAAALLGSVASAVAQDSVLTKFLNYRKDVLQEKLFVHADRDVYLTGETMWLKIYAVEASFHTPSDISKVAYVEIVDKDNQSLVREKISLVNGIGAGSVFLPASISSGTYLLRAYTNWMQNFSADVYFRKPITVVNSFVKLDLPMGVSSNATAHDVQLFPEGGTLLAGVVSKIGVKVNDRNGLGVDFRGALVGESNDTIAHFTPLKFGMGSFEFTPEAGKKYRAVVRVAGSAPTTVAVPDAITEGYSLRVEDSGGTLKVTASFRPNIQNGPPVYLLAHTRQQLVKAERKRIAGGQASFEIKKSDLKDGVTHITLFDEHSKPIAERLYFKAPANGLKIAVQSSAPEYMTRSKVTLDVQTDRAVQQMSIAVFRLDSLSSSIGPSHINDFFYLTSDIRGVVESAGYYFGTDANVQAAADNLMLTQGWRRFSWADVLQPKKTFTYTPEFHGHIIRGLVKDMQGNPAQGVLTYITVPGKIIDVYSSRSNSKGEVSFEMKHFLGGQKVLTVTDSVHRVELLSPFSSQQTTARWPGLNLSPSIQKNLLARSVAMQVQKIYFNDQFAQPRLDSTAFFGKADETYMLDEYTRFPVMEEVMREYVPGVLVRKQRDNFKFYLLDMVNKKPIYETPMILLDGVPVFNENKIMAYDPLKVQKLEVVTRKFYHGMSTFPGIVSYTTYNGDLDGFELDTRYVNVDYEGIQLQREFYSPRHEYEKDSEARLPDQRSLIYWDATLATDNTGKQNPQFFTSDVQGTYYVVVEGLTSDGATGSATHVFKVKGIK